MGLQIRDNYIYSGEKFYNLPIRRKKMLKHRSSKKARIHYFVDIFCKCISDYHQRDIQECLKAYLIVTIRIICSSHLVLFTPTTVLNILKCQGKPSTTYQFSSVQLLTHVQLFATPWIAARQASLSITNWRSSLRLTSIEEMWVWSLGGEDPLEREIATHSSILAWEIPWTEEPGGLQSPRVRHKWATNTFIFKLLLYHSEYKITFHCNTKSWYNAFFPLNWSVTALQCCVSSCCTTQRTSYLYTYIHTSHLPL